MYPNIIIMMIMFVQSNAADQQQQQQQKDCLSVCLSKLLFFLHKVDFDFDKYEMHFLLMPKHIFFFFFFIDMTWFEKANKHKSKAFFPIYTKIWLNSNKKS